MSKNEHEWSDKILQGMHRASEILSERRALVDQLRGVVDGLRQERDDAIKECERIAAERDSVLRERNAARVQRDEACAEVTRLHASMTELEAARDIARAEAKSANDAYQAKERAWPQAVQEEAERQMVELVGQIKNHDRKWETASTMLRLGVERQGPDDVLEALREVVSERDGLYALNRRQGDSLHKARQERAAATSETKIDGTLAVVARHSREIGTLQDECRSLRERLARLERQPEPDPDEETDTIPGTSAGLL